MLAVSSLATFKTTFMLNRVGVSLLDFCGASQRCQPLAFPQDPQQRDNDDHGKAEKDDPTVVM